MAGYLEWKDRSMHESLCKSTKTQPQVLKKFSARHIMTEKTGVPILRYSHRYSRIFLAGA